VRRRLFACQRRREGKPVEEEDDRVGELIKKNYFYLLKILLGLFK